MKSLNTLTDQDSIDNSSPQQNALKRVLPHNFEAEKALLGALLLNNHSYERVQETLQPHHFSDPTNGKIYHAIGRLVERGHIADPITLKDYFEQEQALSEIGGRAYLIHLAESVVSIINIQDYARTIHDLYLRRQIIDTAEVMINTAYEFDLDTQASKQIEVAEQKLFDLATMGETNKGFISFDSALTQAIKNAEAAFKRDSHIVGVTSGLKDLDKFLGGLHPSDLIILAGRPSMGKTALATNIAFSAAKSALIENTGAQVAFFSLEMSSEQLAARLLAQESGTPSDKIRRGEISDKDFPKFVDVSRQLNKLPLFIDDTPSLSVSALRARARRLKRQAGLGLIVVDYLQLLQGSAGARAENRVNEISEITRSLKAIAKELNVPVLALSQLSRAVEQREDKRPQLSDLRESGSIEQDADVVMFVYREEYYEARKAPPAGTEQFAQWQIRMDQVHNKAEVILAKQRHGPIGTIRLFFDNSLTKFADLIEKDHLPNAQ